MSEQFNHYNDLQKAIAIYQEKIDFLNKYKNTHTLVLSTSFIYAYPQPYNRLTLKCELESVPTPGYNCNLCQIHRLSKPSTSPSVCHNCPIYEESGEQFCEGFEPWNNYSNVFSTIANECSNSIDDVTALDMDRIESEVYLPPNCIGIMSTPNWDILAHIIIIRYCQDIQEGLKEIQSHYQPIDE